MTYGTIDPEDLAWITRRAEQSNIPFEKLGLEPAFDDEGNPEHPDEVYGVAVIFDGVLDSTFYIQGMYEVNIADWIAERLRALDEGSGVSWEIIVTEWAYEDAGPQRYKVTDES